MTNNSFVLFSHKEPSELFHIDSLENAKSTCRKAKTPCLEAKDQQCGPQRQGNNWMKARFYYKAQDTRLCSSASVIGPCTKQRTCPERALQLLVPAGVLTSLVPPPLFLRDRTLEALSTSRQSDKELCRTSRASTFPAEGDAESWDCEQSKLLSSRPVDGLRQSKRYKKQRATRGTINTIAA